MNKCFNLHLLYHCTCKTYHLVINQNNMTCITSGAGHAYPSGAAEFTPVFSGIRVSRSLVFCVVFCRSMFLSFVVWTLCCLSFDLLVLYQCFAYITIIISEDYGVFLTGGTNLDYDTTASYVLSVNCSDHRRGVSGDFTVDILPNEVFVIVT